MILFPSLWLSFLESPVTLQELLIQPQRSMHRFMCWPATHSKFLKGKVCL